MQWSRWWLGGVVCSVGACAWIPNPANDDNGPGVVDSREDPVNPDDDGSDSAESGDTGTPGESFDCGNGEVEEGEVCDDGVNDGSYGGCEPGCQELGPFCGDGEVDGLDNGEVCDDGNTVDHDGCNADCLESGRTLWSDIRDSYFDPYWLGSIAYNETTGVIVVAGTERNRYDNNTREGTWARAYNGANGSISWERGYSAGADGVSFSDVVALPDGQFVLGGERSFNSWVVWVNGANGDQNANATLDYKLINCDLGSYSFRGIGAVGTNRFVSASSYEGSYHVAVFDLAGNCTASNALGIVDDLDALPGGDQFLMLGRGFFQSGTSGAELIVYDYLLQEQSKKQLALPYNAQLELLSDNTVRVASSTNGALGVKILDAKYNEVDDRTYVEEGVTFTFANLAVDSVDNLVLVGKGVNDKDGSQFAFVRKLDKEANLLWAKDLPLSGTGSRWGWSDVLVDADDNILVTGARDRDATYTMKLSF